MKSPPVPYPRPDNCRDTGQGVWRRLRPRGQLRRSQETFLVGILLALPGLWAPVRAGIDCKPFYKAVEAGDGAAALVAGQDLYVRLAFQADGRDPFYSSGVVLATAQQAFNVVANLYTDPSRVAEWNPGSLWRILPAPASGQEQGAGDAEPGRFLRTYVRLCVNNQIQHVLAAAKAPASMPASTAEVTTDCLVLLMGMLDPATAVNEPNVVKAIAWIVAAGQGGRAMAEDVEHDRLLLACAVSKARLTDKPADREVRRELVDLVASLCKGQHVTEALALCAAARDITRDAAYSGILVLQQAVIAGRDQKDYALAVRLCDEVAAATGDANTIVVAKYMAGTFLLEQSEYPEVVRRMASLAKDAATPLPYRLKASTLRATALIGQNKEEEAARVLSEAVEGLAESEPAEAADCRQTLCQALLTLQRYEEARRQCQVLNARHPGHPGVKVALQLMEEMTTKSDKVGGESRK